MRHLSGPANPLNAFHNASCIADFIVQIAKHVGKHGCPVRRPAGPVSTRFRRCIPVAAPQAASKPSRGRRCWDPTRQPVPGVRKTLARVADALLQASSAALVGAGSNRLQGRKAASSQLPNGGSQAEPPKAFNTRTNGHTAGCQSTRCGADEPLRWRHPTAATGAAPILGRLTQAFRPPGTSGCPPAQRSCRGSRTQQRQRICRRRKAARSAPPAHARRQPHPSHSHASACHHHLHTCSRQLAQPCCPHLRTRHATAPSTRRLCCRKEAAQPWSLSSRASALWEQLDLRKSGHADHSLQGRAGAGRQAGLK